MLKELLIIELNFMLEVKVASLLGCPLLGRVVVTCLKCTQPKDMTSARVNRMTLAANSSNLVLRLVNSNKFHPWAKKF